MRLLCMAVTTKNGRACASISDHDTRQRCRSVTAVFSADRGTEDTDCENITESDYRKSCQASRSKDITLCASIADRDIRHYCQAKIDHNPALCTSIEVYDLRLRCQQVVSGGNQIADPDQSAASGATVAPPSLIAEASLTSEDAGVGVDGALTGDLDGAVLDDRPTWTRFLDANTLPKTDCEPYKAVADMWFMCMAIRGSRPTGCA